MEVLPSLSDLNLSHYSVEVALPTTARASAARQCKGFCDLIGEGFPSSFKSYNEGGGW